MLALLGCFAIALFVVWAGCVMFDLIESVVLAIGASGDDEFDDS